MLTIAQIAKSGSEHAIQSALFAWAGIAATHGFHVADAFARGTDIKAAVAENPSYAVFELDWLHAIPNGGARGDSKTSKIRGSQMKSEGVRAGVADIFWPVARKGYHGLYIEMKTPTGGIQPKQKEFRNFVLYQGYAFSYERSWSSAAALIRNYYTEADIVLNDR